MWSSAGIVPCPVGAYHLADQTLFQSGYRLMPRKHDLPTMCIAAQSQKCIAGLAPIVAPQRTSSSRRVRAPQDVEATSSQTPRRRRQKAPQPTLVIMPDGMGLCFAVQLPDGNSTKDSMLDQPANSQHGDSVPQHSTLGSIPDQQQQQQQSQHHVSGHMQQSAAVTTGSDVQPPVPADIELGAMARHEAVNLPGQPELRPVQG